MRSFPIGIVNYHIHNERMLECMTTKELEQVDDLTNIAMDLVRKWYPRTDSGEDATDSDIDDEQYSEMHFEIRKEFEKEREIV